MKLLVKRASSQEELSDAYSVRYKVYCLERGYEKVEKHPEGLERDEYDQYAVHLVAYVNSFLPVGTVRLILNNPFGFPVERYCNVSVKEIHPDNDGIAEISRLAVSSDVKKASLVERTQITLSLIRELYYTARELNIQYLVAAMGQPLERLLKKCGMTFITAGPPVDYHGLRSPYYAAFEDLERELFNKRKDLFEFFFPETLKPVMTLGQIRRPAAPRASTPDWH